MAQQNINIGSIPNDGTGDTLRVSMSKSEANFTELYGMLPDNVVVVNAESDFPTQDGTTITLEANKQYFIGASITTSKRFIVEDGVKISSISTFTTAITYTGSGTMFTSSAANWQIQNIRVDCPSATFMDFTDGIFLMSDVNLVSCVDLGTFSMTPATNRSVVIDNCAFLNVTGQGYALSGNFVIFSVDKLFLVSTSASHVGIDFDTSVCDNVEISNYEAVGVAGGIALKGAASSANVSAASIATVKDSRLNGGGITTPLSGIDPQDLRWSFRDNAGTQNSRNTVDAYLTSPEVVTITTSSTFVPVNGTNWVSTEASRFSVDVDGIATYLGLTPITVKLSGFATVEKVGGGSDEVEVRFAHKPDGGAWSTLVQSGGTTQSVDPTSIPLEAILQIDTNDQIDMYIANNGSTANINVNKASTVIVEI